MNEKDVEEVLSGKIHDIDAEKFKRFVIDCVRAGLYAMDYSRASYEEYIRLFRMFNDGRNPDPEEVSGLWPHEER